MHLSESPPRPLPPHIGDSSSSVHEKAWMRGVNLGGWLVLERYISPYLFAVTDCHLHGDYCWYPGQLSAPPKSHSDYKLCDDAVRAQCSPVRTVPQTGNNGEPDYPIDEFSLGTTFLNANRDAVRDNTFRNEKGIEAAEKWLNYHFANFIQESDIKALSDTGLTHLRLPLPHWILGNVLDDEPWIVGERWEAFLRLCTWARKYDMQIWPDIHTSPGSQNGFDNSGHALGVSTCGNWANNPEHVERSLQVIDEITRAMAGEGVTDVVTGFGLLNEPFKDCNRDVYGSYLKRAKNIARRNLGNHTAIYASDMFLAPTFNDGQFWLDPDEYSHTFLDSHYYHVFDENPRALSPRQHIAFTCEHDWKDATSCCYDDPTHPWYLPWKKTNTQVSRGVRRIVGEWSAAYDTLVAPELDIMMKGIAETGVVPKLNKIFTRPEMDFLRNFVQAQMVAYEAVDTGTSDGWFYWTAKMEGSAFAEWDFLRGVREGWIPVLADVHQPSQDLYGTCYDILFKTNDDSEQVVHVFPDPADLPEDRWRGVPIDDDIVLSHGQLLMEPDGIHHRQRYNDNGVATTAASSPLHVLQWFLLMGLAAGLVHVVRKYIRRRRKQAMYTSLPQETSLVEV